MEARWLDPQRNADRAARNHGLHPWQRPQDMAVVGAMVAVISEYLGRHLDHFARIADVSGDC
jgi:hypothetical protein